MISPITALVWEIWLRNRRWCGVVAGIVLFGWLFSVLLPDSYRLPGSSSIWWLRDLPVALDFACLLIVFGIFDYTESNSQKDVKGFPRRLFTLPVSSLLLVALPMTAGVLSAELVYLTRLKIQFTHDEVSNSGLIAILLGTFMVLYQTILWTLGRLGALRVLVLGVVGIVFLCVPVVVSIQQETQLQPRPPTVLIAVILSVALAGFLISWAYVARLRSGGGNRREWLTPAVESMADRLFRRSTAFSSPAAAQFWLEWRRSGVVFPLLIGGLLCAVIGPLSWYLRNDPESTLQIFLAVLAMPVVIALPIGKGFSKPDFWSTDLALSSFAAIRPMATDEMVMIKMKVSAISSAVAWLLVLAFLSIWMPFWANRASFAPIQTTLRHVFSDALYPQYAIAILSLLIAVLLTWRFLVAGLWIGLSGNKKLFALSAVPYAFLPVVGLPLAVLYNERFFGWAYHYTDRVLPALEWTAVLALAAKLAVAIVSSRRISPQRIRQYLMLWLAGTLSLIAAAIFVWIGLQPAFHSEVRRLRILLILIALLLIPLARLALATSSLARNRHR